MKGRNKEFSTQDFFSAYLKTAVRNTKIKYIKRNIKIQELETPIESAANIEAASCQGDYYQHMEEQVSRLCEDFGDVTQLLNLIENESLLAALMKLDDERKKLIFWRVINGMGFEEIAERLRMPLKKAVDTYYNTLKKLRKEIRNG
ncbi:MAG: sigma-70 family RNA polymerase sigma factor [Hungatella sp.]|jgi:RNA polymerase sigma factor (sigma-70 family)|nr:sigma-70 family RNA polymerase sigma factor [Hungatella sp.]